MHILLFCFLERRSQSRREFLLFCALKWTQAELDDTVVPSEEGVRPRQSP